MIIGNKDFVLSFGNRQITSKNAIIDSLTINQSIHSNLVDIEIKLKCLHYDFVMELLDDDYKPSIKNKKVDDCTIRELLFAVRQKVNEK